MAGARYIHGRVQVAKEGAGHEGPASCLHRHHGHGSCWKEASDGVQCSSGAVIQTPDPASEDSAWACMRCTSSRSQARKLEGSRPCCQLRIIVLVPLGPFPGPRTEAKTPGQAREKVMHAVETAFSRFRDWLEAEKHFFNVRVLHWSSDPWGQSQFSYIYMFYTYIYTDRPPWYPPLNPKP